MSIGSTSTDLLNMLTTQGSKGQGTLFASSISSGTGSTSTGLGISSDLYQGGNAVESSAIKSLISSNTNISNAESLRDNALINALSGSGTTGSAITADNAITSAVENSINTQTNYTQYLKDLTTPFNNATNLLANASEYTGGVLNNLTGLISNTGSIGGSVSSALSLSSNTAQVDRRIRLRPKSGIKTFVGDSFILKPLIETNGLMFPFTPVVQLNRQTRYGEYAATHNIQDYKAFSGTSALSVQIEGIFTAQNQDEALYMLASYHFLKACSLMSFGKDSLNVAAPGTPPPVLLLSGYGAFMMNDLPIIIEDCNMELPNDVDYVGVKVNGAVTNLPTKTTISIKGTVQNTPSKLRQFDWGKYVQGSLMSDKGWF